MKKSQILAALALAFALGVVVPVAGANVSVYALNATEEADILSIDKKLDEIYKGLGTIVIYDANKVQQQKTGADAYNPWYITYNNDLVSAQNAITNAKNATVSTASSAAAQLRTDVMGVISSDGVHVDADIMNASSDMGELFDSVWGTTGTFNDIKSITTAIRDKLNTKISSLNTIAASSNDQAYRNRLEAYRDRLNTVLGSADTILSDAITAATATARGRISTVYAQLTGDYTISINNEAELNSAISTIESKLPKLAYFRRVSQSVQNLTTMKNNIDNYSHRQVEAELQTADKAIAGSISTADPIVTPSDPDTTIKPGNTGLVGSAEGTATTVSIVAGLATALTALGAGVVVYRNARREK